MSYWELFARKCDLDSVPLMEDGDLAVDILWKYQNVIGVALVPLVKHSIGGGRHAYLLRGARGAGIETPKADEVVVSWTSLDPTDRNASVKLALPEGAEFAVLLLLVRQAITSIMHADELSASDSAPELSKFNALMDSLTPLPPLKDLEVKEVLAKRLINFPIPDTSVIERPA